MKSEWVVVKGVAHFADSSANKPWEVFASVMGASLVSNILSDPFVFEQWPHHGGMCGSVCVFSNCYVVIVFQFSTCSSFECRVLASSGNQRILNVRVMAVRDIKLRARLLKFIFLSRNFQPIQMLKY